jgi:hypothetical protein
MVIAKLQEVHFSESTEQEKEVIHRLLGRAGVQAVPS